MEPVHSEIHWGHCRGLKWALMYDDEATRQYHTGVSMGFGAGEFLFIVRESSIDLDVGTVMNFRLKRSMKQLFCQISNA